ncbi:MAG TPA: ester cyclase [Methylocystis sp.]|nr:ester cyclase [Methylocystis sp.]
METSSLGPREQARLQIVEEHVRLENSHDLEGVLGTFGPDARYDDEPWDDHRVGRDHVQSYYEELMAASSDFRIDVVNRYVTVEGVILDAIINGTHTGPWRGLPATGRSFSFPLCGIFTFDSEDRIFGEKIFYDRATVFRQLGVFREPVTTLGRVLIAVNHPLTLAGALVRNLFRR